MPKLNNKRKNSRHRCCVCFENSNSFSYFALPRKEDVKKKWLSFFSLECSEVTDNSRVCSKHFEENDFNSSTKDGHVKRILKKDRIVIPTLLPSRQKLTRTVGGEKCVICGPSDGDGNRCYFPFPMNSDEMLQRWSQFCELTPEEIFPSYRLCSDHFTPDVIRGSTAFCKKRSLDPNAVPSFRFNTPNLDGITEVVCTLNENTACDLNQIEATTSDDEPQRAATILQYCTSNRSDVCSQQVSMNVELQLHDESRCKPTKNENGAGVLKQKGNNVNGLKQKDNNVLGLKKKNNFT